VITDPNSSFDILAPARWTAPMVFNSPHSGSGLPSGFFDLTNLSPQQLRASEDSHIDELFSGCADAGAPMLRSLMSRAYLDLNREPFELDARMFAERLPSYVNTASPRVASGLGTIPRTVGDGIVIYKDQMTFVEAQRRIDALHRPYHRALGALLEEAWSAMGMVLLVDCHSMPCSAVSHMRSSRGGGIDVVLGDRFGSACDADVTELVERHFIEAGLTVSRNKPYSGGFFTENHGRPRQARHAIQIELNRALYMDEDSRLPHAGFAELKGLLDRLAKTLATWLETRCSQVVPGFAAAAE
jgi:N-formylglutamate amidohydrolase